MKISKTVLSGLLVVLVLFGCLGSTVAFADDPEVKAGDIVKFGHYEQGANTENGEEVEWLVLDVKENEALLISKYVLENRAFNDADNSGSIWENSSIRNWLNDEFLKTAFTEKEQEAILISTVDNNEERQGSDFWFMLREPVEGKETEDKIYILSYAEALEYFKSDSDRAAEVTKHVYNNMGWWLRSPGMLKSNAMTVKDTGAVNENESTWETSTIGVRPVMKVKLEAIQ
jgi:hypothetical protein